jgi:hypothetical protein
MVPNELTWTLDDLVLDDILEAASHNYASSHWDSAASRYGRLTLRLTAAPAAMQLGAIIDEHSIRLNPHHIWVALLLFVAPPVDRSPILAFAGGFPRNAKTTRLYTAARYYAWRLPQRQCSRERYHRRTFYSFEPTPYLGGFTAFYGSPSGYTSHPGLGRWFSQGQMISSKLPVHCPLRFGARCYQVTLPMVSHPCGARGSYTSGVTPYGSYMDT